MAKINDGTLKDWKDGDKVTSDLYEADREILRVANNDNHDRIVTLEVDKPIQDKRLDDLEYNVTGTVVPMTFKELGMQNLTFDDIKLGYVDQAIAKAWKPSLDTLTRGIVEETTATDGQTVVNLTNSYTVGGNQITVEIDGVPQDDTSYTETSTTSITLSEALVAGQRVVVTIGKVDPNADARFSSLTTQMSDKAKRAFVTPEEFSGADDTAKIQAAIDYASTNNIKRVLCLDKVYTIKGITVKTGVELAFNTFQFPYLTNFNADQSASFLIGLKADPSYTGVNVYVQSTGGLKNVMVYGSTTNLNYAVQTESGSNIDGLYVTHGYNGAYINDSDFKRLRIIGCLNDGLYTTGADVKIEDFQISRAGANGWTMENYSTINILNGKIEWSGKNNLYVKGYNVELSFTSVIIDGANWFDVFIESGVTFRKARFNDLELIGSRRDLTNFIGVDPVVDPAYSAFKSPILTKSSSIQLQFNGGYFREANSLEASLNNLNTIDNFISSPTSFSIEMLQINGMDLSDISYFSIRHGNTGCSSYSINATKTADTSSTLGNINNAGSYVIPNLKPSDITNSSISKNSRGVYVYDTSNQLVLSSGGSYYDTLGNQLIPDGSGNLTPKTQRVNQYFDMYASKPSSATNWLKLARLTFTGTFQDLYGEITTYITTFGSGLKRNKLYVKALQQGDMAVAPVVLLYTSNDAISFGIANYQAIATIGSGTNYVDIYVMNVPTTNNAQYRLDLKENDSFALIAPSFVYSQPTGTVTACTAV
jgi:uncharacterized protein YjbI with pentapeptide repeats